MNKIHLLAALCGAALFLSMGITVSAAPVTQTVGDPNNPGALSQAVQDAYKSGARHIVIKPGVYVIPNTGHSALTLEDWQDAVLSAYGVTIIVSDLAWNHNVIDMLRCTNVTVAGPLLSQITITSYQGRVIAVGKDPSGKATCDWRPDAGYPIPPDKEPKGFLGGDVNIVDAHTRLLKTGNGDFYGVPGESLGDGTFRVHFNQPTLNFGVGDWLVGRYGNAPFKVHVVDCRNCTIKDVTMMRNGFANVREENGGGNHYLHCIWAIGPRPKGATEEPLVTNAADGMHMTSSDPGPDIENCVFQGVFLDDCIAIHGYFAKIKSVSGTALTLDGGPADLKVGQPGRISDNTGFFGEATVTALKDNGDNTWTVTLDKDLGVPANTKISNPLRDGAGYKIIGCRLGNTRSRGILVKADNGLIKNNVIEDCGQAAVSIGPEYYWGESDYAHNVTVEGNTFRENGLATYGGGTVLVHGDGAIGNRNIVIQNNHFASNYQGDIDAQWTDGMTISGNVITGAPVWPAGMGRQSPVLLSNCRAVALRGNVVKNAAAYKPVLVYAGPNLGDVTGNDPSGIRTAPALSAPASASAYVHDGSPTDTNLRYVGRWDRHDSNAYHSYWCGAYLRANFTGTSIGFNGGSNAGGPTVMVSVDGEPLREVNGFKDQPLKPGAHTLLLGSPGQNFEVEFKGLTLSPGAVTLPVPARPIIEFVGDSITAFGGSPSTVNYAWQTAEALGCDHVQIAFSARALTTGFGCSGDNKVGLDTQYFQLKNFNHASDSPQVPWDFSYTPKIIAINLGQNDQCGSEPNDTMTASYVHFVQKLRAKFPTTQIAALRPFGGPYEAAIRQAVATLNSAGDTRVHFIDTTGWLVKEDFGDGVHPTAAGNAKVAARLTPLLKPLLAGP